MRRTGGCIFSILAVVVIIFFLDLTIESARSSPTTVFGPYVMEPGFSVGAPWDRVKIGINLTDAEYPVETPKIFYTFGHVDKEFPLLEANFSKDIMKLEEGNEFWGFWTHEFPEQENGTVIWFYVSLLDSSGSELSPISSPEEASQFRILTPGPTFRIQYLAIDHTDEKDLTADVTCTIMMQYESSNDFLSVHLSDQIGPEQHLLVPRSTGRFFYSKQFQIQGLRLIGDPTSFPFDDYELRLRFYSHLPCDPEFEPEDVSLIDYNDRSIWALCETISERELQHGSEITATIDLGRKTENAYYFVVPTIVCFVLLGGSHVFPSHENPGLRNRLTIYLTIFVFVMGSFSANQVIQNMIPAIAQRITVAELTLTWLAAYLGVYALFSLLGYFFRNVGTSSFLDALALAVSLSFFFLLKVVDIELPYDRVLVHTLSEHIPRSALWFKGLILLGLSYGLILSAARRYVRQIVGFLSKVISELTSQVTPPIETDRSNRVSSETSPEALKSEENETDIAKSEASSSFKESRPTHEIIDHLFEIALVLVTVLSASEIQFVSAKRVDELDFVFKELTIPIIILILVWLIKELVPAKLPGLPLRRFLKEFCWAFLSLFLVLEILSFIFLGFITDSFQTDLSVRIMVFLAAILTFPVTWKHTDNRNWKTEKSVWFKPIIEHTFIYLISYFVLVGIILASILPSP